MQRPSYSARSARSAFFPFLRFGAPMPGCFTGSGACGPGRPRSGGSKSRLVCWYLVPPQSAVRPRTRRRRRATRPNRCVHWYRNIFSHVPSTKVREIAAMLKAIHASEDIAAAREKAVRVIEKLRRLRLARAAEHGEAAIKETLAYYAFPKEHCRRVLTNNA